MAETSIESDKISKHAAKGFESCMHYGTPICPHRMQELLINVAPKKPNWDLRRDINKKLEKLERRTQRAMIQIMQEQERKNLEAEGGVQD